MSTEQQQINMNRISREEEEERRPWFIWIISSIQICVFIEEIIYN